jgi:small subunit ribosomal protein S21
VRVVVRDNNVDKALKSLKHKLQQEGILREMKRHAFYEKPSEKRVREERDAVKRERKRQAKRIERDGF